MIKTISGQFGVYPLAKVLYFEILTRSPTLNFGSLSLELTFYSA